jgi:uncharacterized protein (DUF488 family)
MALFTIGHGTASAGRLVELLRGAGIAQLVDVRTAPGSRRNPDVLREAMQRWLPEQGVGYRWEPRLGGWRKAPRQSPDSVLHHRAFAGYAAHMRSPEFLAAIDELLADPARTAVMCAEALWWRCHRRMIADFVLLARGVDVRHILHDGRLDMHRPTEGVRVREDGLLVYDGGQTALPGMD